MVNPFDFIDILSKMLLYLLAKNILNRQIIFRLLDLAFPQLYCLKFSFKLVNFSKSNARK